MSKYRVSNVANGPRFFHSNEGTFTLDPARSKEVEFDDGDGNLKSLEGNKDFHVAKLDDKSGGDMFNDEVNDKFTDMSDEELIAHLTARDNRPPRTRKRETLLRNAREAS